MKLLFLTAHYYLPQMYGGLQRSTDQFCKTLQDRGHEVAVLSKLMSEYQLEMRTNGVVSCEVDVGINIGISTNNHYLSSKMKNDKRYQKGGSFSPILYTPPCGRG